MSKVINIVNININNLVKIIINEKMFKNIKVLTETNGSLFVITGFELNKNDNENDNENDNKNDNIIICDYINALIMLHTLRVYIDNIVYKSIKQFDMFNGDSRIQHVYNLEELDRHVANSLIKLNTLIKDKNVFDNLISINNDVGDTDNKDLKELLMKVMDYLKNFTEKYKMEGGRKTSIFNKTKTRQINGRRARSKSCKRKNKKSII
jgi:hypothetical protein